MANNHLIIGLGGTGGKIIAAYRKLIFERFNNLRPNGLWIDYIYMDSSESDLNEEGGIWSNLGSTIALDSGSKISIKPANLKHYIENIDNYPYLKPWIGETQEWKFIINDPKVLDGAAGQKRRLGRFLFANKAPDFITVLDSKVRGLQQNRQGQKITFHICCGLAGGTGSGSFVDVITQIRKNYNNHDLYKIVLYVMLPEENPNKAWATTSNYQPNGYAALLELNALDYQIFKPYDVGERQFAVKRMEPVSPFYTCYIITEQNEANVKFDVDKVLPTNIAEFLFQKTAVVQDDGQGANAAQQSMLNRMEAGENPQYGEYGFHHSFKFQTFGVKRIAIPEQEIKEYFTYNFLKQVFLQSIYNHPTTEGYDEEPVPFDDYSEITKRDNLNRWSLTIEHLCLSIPVLPNHKTENWKRINDEIANASSSFKNEIFTEKKLDEKKIKKELWLDALKNRTEQYFDREFRPIGQVGGVKEFYNTKRRTGLDEITKKIVQDIETDLFSSWANGTLSLGQLSNRIKSLGDYLTDQTNKFDGMKDDNIKNIQDCDVRLREVNSEWVKQGILGVLLNNDDKRLDKYIVLLNKKYSLLTWNEGYSFAKELLIKINESLLILKKTIDDLNSDFNKGLKQISEEFNSRCNDDLVSPNIGQKTLIKYYNPQKVRELGKQILKKDKFLKEQISILRGAIINLGGSTPAKFKSLLQQGIGSIIPTLEREALLLTENFFNNPDVAQQIPGYEKLLGENIISKYKEEYGGNDTALKTKLKELIQHAAVLVRYDEAQKQDGPKINQGLLIILPDYNEDQVFLNKMISIFQSLTVSVNFQIETGGRSNEIIIINLHSNMALRYLNQVGILRRTYDSLMESPQGKIAKFETQLENYDKLPSLYKLSIAERAEEMKNLQNETMPYLLLAKGMDIVQVWTNPETGIKSLAIFLKDEDGLDADQIDLGKTIELAVQKIDSSKATIITNEVNRLLKFNFKHIDRQEILKKNILALIDDLKARNDNNPANITVKLFNDAARKAFVLIKELNN